jgi:hypothetical protein
MWRDYESANGGCVETFPGYRAVAQIGKQINGIYNYRTKNGYDYLIVHAGQDLYAFTATQLAALGGVSDPEADKLLENTLEDGASTAYLFNNNLYILDGSRILEVKAELQSGGIESLAAGEVVGYVPTTYYDGKPYEQRNMLSEYAYEIVTQEATESVSASQYRYTDTVSSNRYSMSKRTVKGFGDVKLPSLTVSAPSYKIEIVEDAFKGEAQLTSLDIICCGELKLGKNAFKDCKNLKTLNICINPSTILDVDELIFDQTIFDGCSSLQKVNVYCQFSRLATGIDTAFPTLVKFYETELYEAPESEYNISARITEVAGQVIEVRSLEDDKEINYGTVSSKKLIGDEEKNIITYILVKNKDFLKGIKVKLMVYPNHFSAIAGADNFLDGNLDYKKTGAEAINGCTKCAVFDGRVFLTGNRELPNTVFYNQRNLTGASDPTYFGAYNYINDGVGNVPNVELLATPSYLMVLKQDTVQDGSIYYHTPADNTHSDQVIRNLLPRIYPSISGAAGIGSAGDTVPGATVCNFLDDPVFISKRGLSAVEKQQVNLERSIARRSGNVDRLLIKEDLAHAALAEWKGYLMILVNGNVYMADSRSLSQHPDGSYQYEWFYLTGIGAWESYNPQFRYCTGWPMTDSGVRLDEYRLGGGALVGDEFKISAIEGIADGEAIVSTASSGDDELTIYTVNGCVVEQIDGELRGEGAFYGADKMAVMGERLFFGTTNGYLLCVNSDMRDGEGILPRDAYTFNGVSYESGCATRLDDCGQIGLAKCTVPGTVVAEFKMMPGSRCRVNVSLNGRDFRELFSGAVGSTRFDFGDLDFSNFAFTENESNITVLREMTRNFIRKQYYIYSDGYKEPFGLCGLTYQYYVKGKIRR